MIYTNKLPVCYHPTKVLLVDDDVLYLAALKSDLDISRATYQYFDDPISCLEYLNAKYLPRSFANRCIKHPEEESIDTRLIEVDARKIYQEAYNESRFDEISVVIVDYAMPELNGLEFCRRIKDLPIKKVLLTGYADEKLAVEAFNNGIIDRFIRKEQEDFSEAVNNEILQLQLEYFYEQSTIIINSLTQDFSRTTACINNREFIKLFSSIMQNNRPTEFYLTDSHGTFMFLDMEANPSWLVMKSEEEMYNLTEYARTTDASANILDALNARTLIPYFHSDEDLKTPVENWAPYLHKANALNANELYYYSYVSNTPIYNINREKIYCYKQYLSK